MNPKTVLNVFQMQSYGLAAGDIWEFEISQYRCEYLTT